MLDETGGNVSFLVDRKLKPYKTCWKEGCAFIDISESMLKAGFVVKFMEEHAGEKSPDLEILNPSNGDKLYVEVSQLGDSAERAAISKNYHCLFKQFHSTKPLVLFSCRQKLLITDDQLPQLIAEIQKVKILAHEEKEFVVYEDSLIALAAAHPSCRGRLEEWADANNRGSLDLTGLDLDFDDTNRIRNNKIKKKAAQIPKGFNGLLYLNVSPLYFWVVSLSRAAKELEAEFSRVPQILGVAMYSHIRDSGKPALSIENGHLYHKMKLSETLSQDLFFVSNKSCELRLQEETLIKMYSTFLGDKVGE